MELSVIIPTFNRVELIKYTLNSLNIKYHPQVEFEIIVVDDGSTDNTIEFIKNSYSDVILLQNTGRGAPSARNTGLAAARGKYILYLDSDDLVGPGFFKQKIEYLNKNPALLACYGSYEMFESNTDFSIEKIIFKYKYPIIKVDNDRKTHLINYLGGNFLPPNSIIWRRTFLIEIGGHDVSLAINQDVELMIRALLNGLTLAPIQDSTFVYIRHHTLDNRVGDPKNASQKWIQILELRKKILHKLAQYGLNDIEYKVALSNYTFGYWKILRHSLPKVADEYLKFSKETFWPVEIMGNIFYRLLGKIFGPVIAVKIKYLLLRRD